MLTLDKEQLDLIDTVNTGNIVDFTTVTRLYIVQSGEWMYTGLCGAMTIVKDVQYDTWFLRLVDLDLREIVWEQEFYLNFQYFKATGWLHTVECDGHMAGLSFASVPEGKAFFEAVLKAKTEGLEVKKVKKEKKGLQGVDVKRKMSSAIKFSKKAGKNVGKKIGSVFEKEEKEEFLISGPRNFRHSSHIGWEADSGFEIRDIPEAWKRIFKASGIKKSELKDKETAAYIMEVISNTMGVAVEDIGDAPPPEMMGGTSSAVPSPQSGKIASNAPPPPPPPPAPGMGPPPPGPINSGPPPSGNGGPPPPSRVTAGTTSVFDQIKMGASLKKVEENERPSSHSPGGTLADTLAVAMANRRGAVDSESDDDGDGWSSED